MTKPKREKKPSAATPPKPKPVTNVWNQGDQKYESPADRAARVARARSQAEELRKERRAEGAYECPACHKQRPHTSFPTHIFQGGKWVENKVCDPCIRAAQGSTASVRARPQPMRGGQK